MWHIMLVICNEPRSRGGIWYFVSAVRYTSTLRKVDSHNKVPMMQNSFSCHNANWKYCQWSYFHISCNQLFQLSMLWCTWVVSDINMYDLIISFKFLYLLGIFTKCDTFFISALFALNHLYIDSCLGSDQVETRNWTLHSNYLDKLAKGR